MNEQVRSTSRTDSALRWIGDLDHPFYSDERNRFVWYEASAIAFQFLFLGSYFMGGLVLWIGGAAALPYTLAMFAPALAAAMLFQGYLKRNCAEYWPGRKDLHRWRGRFGVLAPIVLISGALRALVDWNSQVSESEGGTLNATIVGVIAGSLAGVATVVYKSRQQASDEEDEF